MTLTQHDVKFGCTPTYQTMFIILKEACIQAPILHYPDTSKCYIVYTDASDDAHGAQMCQEHNSHELPVAFLSHTFTETQCKWSSPEQLAYGVYHTITM